MLPMTKATQRSKTKNASELKKESKGEMIANNVDNPNLYKTK